MQTCYKKIKIDNEIIETPEEGWDNWASALD
jgi:hypothetical protein